MKAIILDDDETYLYIIETLLSLQQKKIEHLQFTDPEEAFEFMLTKEGKTFDTILLDLNMPCLNGWEFLDKMKEQQIHKSVFILTSSVDESDLEKSKQYADIIAYYVKPIKKYQLAEILNYKK